MSKFELFLSTSLMNSAGSLGYFPPNQHPDFPRLGAFVTNPVSLKPRSPTRNPTVQTFPGGFLLHTGYPNPGMKAILKQYGSHWSRLEISVIVHLLCDRPDELPMMIKLLEKFPSVSGIEIGLNPKDSMEEIDVYLRDAFSELPLILCMPMDKLIGFEKPLTKLFNQFDIAALSFAPPRGLLPQGDNRLVHGRLFGPALFPQALALVQNYASEGIPVIGGCGVYTLDQAETMIAAGAMAVQLDAVLWRGAIPDK